MGAEMCIRDRNRAASRKILSGEGFKLVEKGESEIGCKWDRHYKGPSYNVEDMLVSLSPVMAVIFSSDDRVMEFGVEETVTKGDMKLLTKIKGIFGNPSCSEEEEKSTGYEIINDKRYYWADQFLSCRKPLDSRNPILVLHYRTLNLDTNQIISTVSIGISNRKFNMIDPPKLSFFTFDKCKSNPGQ